MLSEQRETFLAELADHAFLLTGRLSLLHCNIHGKALMVYYNMAKE